MKSGFVLAFLLLPFGANANVRTVLDLPPAAYADTEVSSNVVFNATRGDAKFFDVRLELTGTVSNNVQIAFGRDADGDGDLALEETGLVLAWRGGRYCVEDVPESERIVEAAASESYGLRFLHMRVMTGRDFKPRTASFTNEAGPCFAGLSASAPDWLYRPEWNLLKVTRRGVDSSSEWCRVECDYRTFVIRIK